MKNKIIQIINEREIKSVNHFNNFKNKYSKSQRKFRILIFAKIFIKNTLSKWRKI